MGEYKKNFEAYFTGRMNSAQANDFQTALKANSNLDEKYQEFVAIKQATRDIERNKMRQLLGDAHSIGTQQARVDTNSNSASIIPLFKKIAGVAAIFIIGFWTYQTMQETSSAELFAQNFEVYKTQQSRGIDKEFPILDKRKSTTETALLIASEILNDGQSSSEKIQESIEYLTQIPDESSFRDQKYWYLGLASLKIDDKAEAVKHFTYLQSISNYKNQEIENILSVIQK